ncbi:MAG: Rrf2 family transcriptional regulator [Streptococcaceae bacterium]|jgi:Rrf2 family protein|nr:Rrf2 family transcriptional regulator [Streptococcaceae bacterium]
MKLSSGWEQGVYVLLILSLLPEKRAMSSLALADRLKVSPSYLKKIIKSLVNENLVKSSPGKNGGFSLKRNLTDITFYDVFTAIEGRGRVFESQHLLANFLDLPQSETTVCAVSTALTALEISLMETMSKFKLSQMLKDNQTNYDLSNLTNWIAEHVN